MGYLEGLRIERIEGKYCAECKLKRNGGRCLQFGQLEWCVDDLGGFIRHADCLEAEIVEAEKV